MDEEEKERLQNIVNDLNRDVKMPPYNNNSERGYSREYKSYKEDEREEQQLTSYEKFCMWSANLLKIKSGDYTRDKLSPSIRLLDWEISPGMVLSAAVMAGFFSFVGWFLCFILNFLLGMVFPIPLLVVFMAAPAGLTAYTYYKPVLAAKDKMIKSSGEMILSILYMVVYMRSSPNLEGAVRFAALNLEGPISKDLKGILWELEVGNYSKIEEALEDYTRRWKGFNDDYLESLQVIQAAMNESDPGRRENLLQDSVDRILSGTQEKMKHYAQSLKTPVMILNAMGAMLPVLGMIMLPLVSVFLGGAIKPIHLFVLFNLILPSFLYMVMEQVLTSRPPTVSSEPVDQEVLPKRGYYTVDILGSEMNLPTWPIGGVAFLVIASYGILGYIAFPDIYPIADPNLAQISSIFKNGDSLAPLPMLVRSISITSGLGLGIGISKVLGSKERKEAEDHLRSIEQQFPSALFQLGNKISGGTPVEVALEDAAKATEDLEISDLFRKASKNVRAMGMTFEQAVFDDKYGALHKFPSRMIHTVMKAILQSSEKGTSNAAMAMTTISRYLENIHETQEQLNDLMEETTTTIQMLAYILAPVISGVAVGMSQTIITAMFKLSQGFAKAKSSFPSSGQTTQFGGVLGNLDQVIPPEVLQFVVGIYLIQLLWILGTFYMKITEGQNKTYRDNFVGKVLIVGVILYTITVLTLGVLFGGIISGIQV